MAHIRRARMIERRVPVSMMSAGTSCKNLSAALT